MGITVAGSWTAGSSRWTTCPLMWSSGQHRRSARDTDAATMHISVPLTSRFAHLGSEFPGGCWSVRPPRRVRYKHLATPRCPGGAARAQFSPGVWAPTLSYPHFGEGLWVDGGHQRKHTAVICPQSGIDLWMTAAAHPPQNSVPPDSRSSASVESAARTPATSARALSSILTAWRPGTCTNPPRTPVPSSSLSTR